MQCKSFLDQESDKCINVMEIRTSGLHSNEAVLHDIDPPHTMLSSVKPESGLLID